MTTEASRTTIGRCIRILEQLGILFARTDDFDKRRKVVEFSEPIRKVIDLYVDECFEEFEDLINSHHNKERRIAEFDLQESEARYRSLVELAPDAILILTDDTIVFANGAAVQIFGVEQVEQLIGRNVEDFIHPDFIEPAARNRQRMLREKTTALRREHKALRLDGSVIEIEVASTYMRWKGADSVQPIIRDITERKQIEAELRRAEQKYHNLFDRALVGLARTRISDGKPLEANTQLAQIYGYDNPEHLLAEAEPMKHWVDPAARERAMAEGLKNGAIDNVEAQHYRKDGSIIWVRIAEFLPLLDCATIDPRQHIRKSGPWPGFRSCWWVTAAVNRSIQASATAVGIAATRRR